MTKSGNNRYNAPDIAAIDTRPTICNGGVTTTVLQVCLEEYSVSVRQLCDVELTATRVTSVDVWVKIRGYPDEEDVRHALEQFGGFLKTIVRDSEIVRQSDTGLPVVEMGIDAQWAADEIREVLSELNGKYRVERAREYLPLHFPSTILLIKNTGEYRASIQKVAERIAGVTNRRNVVLDEDPVVLLREVLSDHNRAKLRDKRGR